MITQNTETFAEITTPVNPFPGLRPFEFDESHLFFGRDGQSERLIAKLGHTRFLAVVGTSGSGKSSLVRAGLLPALHGGFMTSAGSGWRIASMRPGNDPVGNLAQALNTPDVFGSEIAENAAIQTAVTEATLRRGGLGLVDAVRQALMPKNENLLVIADQFEEIFRFARVSQGKEYQNEAAAFVKLILEASRQREVPIYVVLTMRSDYLGDCSQFWDLPEAINESQYLIPRLTRDRLREAIAGPVAVGGGEITPRLVSRLLNDVGDNQDQLPILQHALMRTWDRWKEERRENEPPNTPMDLRHYEVIGGMAEALSQHADEAYNELSGDRQKLAEQIFKCLTEKEMDSREVRRPLTVRELCAVTEADEREVIADIEVFRRQGRSFLMPPREIALTADSLIDISHESLIRNWKRLRDWVEGEARSARIYRRLAETAILYQTGEAGLWHDPDLQIALDWRERIEPNEPWARRYHPGFAEAMSFLEQSRVAREAGWREKENQRRRKLWRTRWLAAIFALAALLLLGLAAYANQQRVKAQKNTEEADKEKKNAQDKEAEARESAKTARENEAEAKRQKNEAERLREIAQVNAMNANRQEALALKNAAEVERQSHISEEKFAELLGLQADKAQRTRDEAQDLGALLAVESLKTPNQFGDEAIRPVLALLQSRETPKKIEGGAEVAAFSQDGKYLATTGQDRFVRVWDAATGQLRTAPFRHDYNVLAVALSQDGTYLATVDNQSVVRVWLAATGQPVGKPIKLEVEVEGGAKQVGAVILSFSPDGVRLVTARDDTAQMWEVATGAMVAAPMKHGDRVNAIAFSRDGRYLATGCGYILKYRGEAHKTYSAAYVWNAATGQPADKPIEFNSARVVGAVALSPDSKYLTTAQEGIIEVWERGVERPVLSIPTPNHTADVVFSPDGNYLAATAAETAVQVWRLDKSESDGGHEVARLIHNGSDGSVRAMAFSPDGKHLSTISDGGLAYTWETSRRDAVVSIPGNESGRLRNIAFSEDGKHLLIAGSQGVQRWEATTGQLSEFPLEDLSRTPASMNGVALSRDGKYLAIGGDIAQVWDLGTRRIIARPQLDERIKTATISPDGRYLASLSEDGTVKLFNFQTRRFALSLTAGNARLIALSPERQIFATANSDRTVRIRRIPEGLVEAKEEGVEVARISLEGEASAMAFSRDGRYLATASGNVAQVWETVTGVPVGRKMEHADRVNAVAFSPDGRRLATASRDQNARIWETGGGQLIGQPLRHEGSVDAVAFSTTGRELATASGNVARVWNAATGQPSGQPINTGKKILAVALRESDNLAAINEGNTAQIWNVANGQALPQEPIKYGEDAGVALFSPDGGYLVAGSRRLEIWRTSGGNRIVTWLGYPPIISLAFSPDSKRLAMADGINTAQVWDMNSQRVAFSLAHSNNVNDFAFSLDGRYLVTASSEDNKDKNETDGIVKIWDAASGQLVKKLKYGTQAQAVAFSPDGKYVAAASESAIRMWVSASGKKYGEDFDHISSVSELAFSPDGKYFVTASGENAQVWDTFNHRKIASLHVNSPHFAFSPDGKYLATASNELARLWLWRSEDLQKEACQRLGRNLTYEEWQSYMGNKDYSKTCEALPVHQSFIDKGRSLASSGNLKDAVAVFRSIREMDPNPKFYPEAEARWHADAAKMEDALDTFAWPGGSVDQEKLKDQIKQTQRLVGLYAQPHTFKPESAGEWAISCNRVCWRGSLYGYAAEVPKICELAVTLDPKNESYRDSRGLARALTGNLKGAIEDFQYYVDRADDEKRKEQRQAWIKDLLAGRNPFTAEELKKLREQ